MKDPPNDSFGKVLEEASNSREVLMLLDQHKLLGKPEEFEALLVFSAGLCVP